MLVGYCASLALLGVYAWLCRRDNKQKELDEAAWRQTGGDAGDVAEEWKDLTDKQVCRVSWQVLLKVRDIAT